jgi:hypothetical protein
MEDIITCSRVLYPNIEVKFSTVKEYLAAIHSKELDLPDYDGDFLPY